MDINIKTILVLLITLLPSGYAFACIEISGVYKSVSESHWNFELSIADDRAILTYTSYSRGSKETRTDTQIVSQGYCEKDGDSYRLVLAGKTLNFNYYQQLSRSSFGGEGSAPGIRGEFIENREVELWIRP